MKSSYGVVRNLPIWKFYYKGSHSKPIRTTIAVTENKDKIVTGYVLRRGNTVCNRLQDAKIQSFKKSEIAKNRQVNSLKKSNNLEDSTLTKYSLMDLVVNGA